MSYFSRHLIEGTHEPVAACTIYRKEISSKTGKEIQIPVISFYEELDPDKILDRCNEILKKKYGPDYAESGKKFSLEVIPPQEEE